MIKEIYDTYASNASDIESLARTIEEAVGIQLTPHEGLYSGNTYRYRGSFSDEIILRARREEDNLDTDLKFIIKVANNQGKNSDKISKSKYVNSRIMQIDSVDFIENYIVEK